MTLFGDSRVNTRSTRYELCSISVSHRHCLRDFKPTKMQKACSHTTNSFGQSSDITVYCSLTGCQPHVWIHIVQYQTTCSLHKFHTASYTCSFAKLHKTLHTKWYKMFSLDVPKYFREMYKIYDIYFPLFFSILLHSRYAP